MENNDKDINEIRKLARDAFKEKDFIETRRRFDEILRIDPKDWEANIYKEFFIANGCKTENIEEAADRFYQAIEQTMEYLSNNANDIIDTRFALIFITLLVDIFTGNKIDESHEEYEVNQDVQKYVDRVCACYIIEYGTGDMIDVLGEKYGKYAADMWESGILSHHIVFEFMDDKKTNYRIMKEYADKIKKYNPSYKFEKPTSNGGCYVATAVYGSYDCPEVWTLRRYRDNILAKTECGRFFIRLYYTASPTFVKWFGKTKWFNRIFKAKLDKLVLNLNQKGIEDTPYNDPSWK